MVEMNEGDMRCPLEPLGARVVCKKRETALTAGGIRLPDGVQIDQYLTVVELGPDCEGLVTPGQHVCIPLYPSEMIAVEAGGDTWFMMAEKSIPAIMR